MPVHPGIVREVLGVGHGVVQQALVDEDGRHGNREDDVFVPPNVDVDRRDVRPVASVTRGERTTRQRRGLVSLLHVAAANQLYSEAASRIRHPIESFFGWIEEKAGIQITSKFQSTKGLVVEVFGHFAAAIFSACPLPSIRTLSQ